MWHSIFPLTQVTIIKHFFWLIFIVFNNSHQGIVAKTY